MADLVVGHQGLALAVHHGGALHAGHNSVHAVINLRQAHGGLAASACEDRSLQNPEDAVSILHLHRFNNLLVFLVCQGRMPWMA